MLDPTRHSVRIALITLAYAKGGLNPVLAFWAAYVLTRPFGASVGDFRTAAPAEGGLGLGTNGTSAIFLTVILGVVARFTVEQRRADRSGGELVPAPRG